MLNKLKILASTLIKVSRLEIKGGWTRSWRELVVYFWLKIIFKPVLITSEKLQITKLVFGMGNALIH